MKNMLEFQKKWDQLSQARAIFVVPTKGMWKIISWWYRSFLYARHRYYVDIIVISKNDQCAIAPNSLRKFGYILQMVDHFSKFIWAAALEEKTMFAVVQQLMAWFARDGKPTILHADNGSEFGSELAQMIELQSTTIGWLLANLTQQESEPAAVPHLTTEHKSIRFFVSKSNSASTEFVDVSRNSLWYRG